MTVGSGVLVGSLVRFGRTGALGWDGLTGRRWRFRVRIGRGVLLGRSYRNLSLRTTLNSKLAGDATYYPSVPFLPPLFSMFLSGLSPLSSLTRPPFPFLV